MERPSIRWTLFIGATAFIGAVAIVAVVLGAPQTPTTSTPHPESSTATGGTMVEADPSLAEQWAAVDRSFDGVERPVATQLYAYKPGEFPYYRAACLENVGIGGFDVSGFVVSTRDLSTPEEATEAYLCAARFPVIGTARSVAPLTATEITRFGTQLSQYRECLEAAGYDIRPTEDARDILGTWPEISNLPLASPGVSSPREWSLTDRSCPPPNPRS